jgi:hypothetical protein
MRKLLALALVASGISAFANDGGVIPQSDQMKTTVTGHAYAKIVPSLSVVETAPLFFGRILQGTTGTVTVDTLFGNRSTTGSIVVSESYSRGTFKSNAPMAWWGGDQVPYTNDVMVRFVNPTNATDPHYTTLKLVNAADPSTPLTLDANCNVDAWIGSTDLWVGGTLTVPEGAKPGMYSTTYQLIAFYY